MAKLTTKELTALEDQLGLEQTLIKKYGAMSTQCTDPALQSKLASIAGRHQKHYTTLIGHLN
ncbi:hypothetical protein FACS18949_11040 [Clostridia bacterium]|nr:hypothetical protein FACS18949_11040 [Clostridia bacterium]